MKKRTLLAIFALIMLFVPAFSEASLKRPATHISIEQAIEAAIGEEPGVAMNARWQRGYVEITIAGDEVRVEKLYVNPGDGRMVGVNLKENEDIFASSTRETDVSLDYVAGYYEIEILKFDGTIRDVFVSEEDGRVFY